jgi:tetratricopeptide (TPR) repeat protein
MNALPGLILLFIFTAPTVRFFQARRLTSRQRNREEPNTRLLGQLGLALLCVSWAFTALAQNHPPAPDPVLVAATKAQREGRLADAEKILADAVHSIEQDEPESPRLALYLRLLANIYGLKHQYSDALALAQRALELDQKAFGPSGGLALGDLANIAGILRDQGKNEEAEQFLKQAIELFRQGPKPDPERSTQLFGNLASLYVFEHRWTDAEPLLQEAMKACELLPLVPPWCDGIRRLLADVYRNEGRAVEADQLVPANPGNLPAELASLEKAAQQYMKDGLYVQAEITYRQAIAWIEQNPKTETRNPFPRLNNWLSMLPGKYNALGQALEKQGLNNDAEAAYKKAIELQETSVDPKQPVSVLYFNFSGLLNLYRGQDRLSELGPIIEHALEIQEKFLGENNTHVAETLLTLADVYREEGKKDDSEYAEAAPLYDRALKIQQANLGTDHPQLLRALTGYVTVLRSLHDEAKPAELQARIDVIRKKSEAQNRHN